MKIEYKTYILAIDRSHITYKRMIDKYFLHFLIANLPMLYSNFLFDKTFKNNILRVCHTKNKRHNDALKTFLNTKLTNQYKSWWIITLKRGIEWPYDELVYTWFALQQRTQQVQCCWSHLNHDNHPLLQNSLKIY